MALTVLPLIAVVHVDSDIKRKHAHGVIRGAPCTPPEGTSQCTADGSCQFAFCGNGPPVPLCNVEAGGVINLQAGVSQNVDFDTSSQDGVIDTVDFSIDDVAVATICNPINPNCGPADNVYNGVVPVDNTTASVKFTAWGSTNPPEDTAVLLPATVTATCHMTATDFTVHSFAYALDVYVGGSDPWWQTAGGDVITGTGGILSLVPVDTLCNPTLASCLPYFMLGNTDFDGDGTPEYNVHVDPGIAIHGGSLSYGSGALSSTGLQVPDSIEPPIPYDYQYFYDKTIAAGTTLNPIGASPNLAALGSGAYLGGGVNIGADVTVPAGLHLVIFVDGNLTIDGKINLAPPSGTTSLMFIVRGDITVGDAVGQASPTNLAVIPAPTPDIEGIYITNQQFFSATAAGSSNVQLYVRGTIVALGWNGAIYGGNNGIVLRRVLANNATFPAEIFEYSPSQILQFPTYLGIRSIRWREVAP